MSCDHSMTFKKGFLLDMDGVLYRGADVVPGATEFVNKLQSLQIPYLFLTNNSRPTARDIAVSLAKRLDIHVGDDQVFTSAMATAYFLSSQKPKGTAYVLGEGGLINAIYDVGYAISESDPDFVIVGEGRTLTLEMVEKAIDMVLAGSKLIATNMDPAPTIKGWPKPGTGAIVAMMQEATGKHAFSVGKPSPILMRAARKKLGLSTAQTVIVGDTMETDILGGINMGYETVLTLTGSTRLQDFDNYPYRPNRVIESVKDLIPLLEVDYVS